MITTIPPIGFLVDLPFGVLMWTSIAQFLLLIIFPEDSNFVLLRILRNLNAAIHKLVNLAKPSFVFSRLLPLYAALLLFVLRYYVFPFTLDYEIWNFYQLPLERLWLETMRDFGF